MKYSRRPAANLGAGSDGEMSFIPYSRQEVTDDDIDAVTAVLRSDFVTQGPAVTSFEAAFAERHRLGFAVAVSNATAGLHVACLALGVGRGSRVWTTPNSFVASANCALYCGASVDFVDIDPKTRNMAIDALRGKLATARQLGCLPSVVIPVDFAGLPCDLREMRELADQYGFRILEDASHATGASYLGQPVGAAYADATVFSFHAVKVITTAEGGIVGTRDPVLAERMRMFRSHGITRELSALEATPDGGWYYEQQLLGYNYRLTDLQAALGESQLRRLPEAHAKRIALADRYDHLLDGLPLLLPLRQSDRLSAWHLYVVEVDDERTQRTRGELFAALRASRIGVNVHYIPIHTQPYFRSLGFRRGDFPAAERYYSRAISIPLFPSLSETQQERVVEQIRQAIT